MYYSQDKISDLVREYNRIRKTINGKTISDIAQVFKQLKDWETIERVDLIIPYQFATKRNEPLGHRIWYLSHFKRSNQFYNGVFFDIQSAETENRCIRKKCKLSEEAIKFFIIYKEVKKNKEIK